MTQAYFDPSRESEPTALPDLEVFFRTREENEDDGWIDGDGDVMEGGWYWWACFPGCLPDGEPCGPFDSEDAALKDARNY